MQRLFGLLIIILSAVAPKAAAQCALSKTVTGSITKVETPENYFYFRDKTIYNSAAVKTISLTKGKASKIGFGINFTTTYNNYTPQTLTLKFLNGSIVTHQLTFKNKNVTDNPKLNVKQFELFLTADDLNTLRIQPLQSLLFTNTTKIDIEIPVNDGTLLQQQINCLQK